METSIVVQIISTVGSVSAVIIPFIFHQRKEHQDHNKLLLDYMEKNTRLTVANARASLESIYNKYKADKSMPQSAWKSVCELHAAYKAVKVDGKVPNSWADEIYYEMEKWEKC